MNLKFVLLAVLSKGPNSGYGIQRLLRGPLSHLWEARLQQIYAELGRAREDGLVDVRLIEMPNRPPKKVYTLTGSGEEALDDWLAERTDHYVPKDSLFIKLFCLERMPEFELLRQVRDRLDRFQAAAGDIERRLAQVPRTNPAQLGEVLSLEAALARAQGHVVFWTRALELLRHHSGDERVPPLEGAPGLTA